MGRFSHRIAKSQNAMYLHIGRLSTNGQQQARELDKLQKRVERGESVLVQELKMFEKTLEFLDQESRDIQAEIVARVEV